MPAVARDGVVHLRAGASHRSALLTQILLGERVVIERSHRGWRRVVLADGYRGWIAAASLVGESGTAPAAARGRAGVRTTTARVAPLEHWIRVAPREEAALLASVVHGSQLAVLRRRGAWCRVAVPGLVEGWIRANALSFDRPRRARAEVIRIARGYLGCPYLWGGTTPRGFDCSGLVQRAFALARMAVPRDAWMQRAASRAIASPSCARPADLFFFGRSAKRPSHVALSLGGLRFIHAASDERRGRVAIESLDPADHDYARDLVPFFLDARSAFPAEPRRSRGVEFVDGSHVRVPGASACGRGERSCSG